MEVEVSRHHSLALVIGRVLYGSEVIDIVVVGNNNHAARMLTGGALDAHTAVNNALYLSGVCDNALVLIILLRETECRLVGDCRDCSGFENVVLAEEFYSVPVRLRLVFAGEIQVDIGRFISLETEEGLKRNIMSVTDKRRAAFRTVLRRQVVTRTHFAV